MFVDDKLEFCDNTAANGTGVSLLVGDVADRLNIPADLGTGQPMYLVIQVSTAYTASGTSIEFQFRSSTLVALTGGTTVTHLTTGAVSTVAILPVGTRWIFPLPGGTSSYQQYLGIWMVTVGAVAGGSIDAFLTCDASAWRAYDDAVG